MLQLCEDWSRFYARNLQPCPLSLLASARAGCPRLEDPRGSSSSSEVLTFCWSKGFQAKIPTTCTFPKGESLILFKSPQRTEISCCQMMTDVMRLLFQGERLGPSCSFVGVTVHALSSSNVGLIQDDSHRPQSGPSGLSPQSPCGDDVIRTVSRPAGLELVLYPE